MEYNRFYVRKLCIIRNPIVLIHIIRDFQSVKVALIVLSVVGFDVKVLESLWEFKFQTSFHRLLKRASIASGSSKHCLLICYFMHALFVLFIDISLFSLTFFYLYIYYFYSAVCLEEILGFLFHIYINNVCMKWI